MGLHPKLGDLAEVADRRDIRIFNKPFGILAGQLEKLGCKEWTVTLDVHAEKPPWWKFVSDRDEQIDRVLKIQGKHDARMFEVRLPVRSDLLIPYSVTVALNARFEGTAVCRKAFVGKKWEWEEHPERLEELKGIPFPKVNPNHNWGGFNFSLKDLMMLQSLPEEPGKTLWMSFSGFEGFVIGVGPRLPKFLRAAPAIESALSKLRMS